MMRRPKAYTVFLLFLWAIIFIKSDLVGKVEGYFFPVVGEFHYVITSQDDTETRIMGEFEKYRNCSFVDLQWSIADDEGQYATVDISFNNQFVIRKKGKQIFYNWEIYNNRYNIENSSIEVRHICHSFWDTITKMK
jgi:hypothetical protein